MALGECCQKDEGTGIMRTYVTGTFATPKFLGVKNIDPSLKKRNEELTDEEMWEKILSGGYEQPYCPDCHSKMFVTRLTMEYQLNPPSTAGTKAVSYTLWNWNELSNTPIIKIEMQCSNCSLFIRGEGMGLNLKDGSYYLEALMVVEKHKAVETWHLQI